jgi:hypothetical protein
MAGLALPVSRACAVRAKTERREKAQPSLRPVIRKTG